MQRNPFLARSFVVACLLALLLVVVPVGALPCAAGAAELRLDRAAVRDLLSAAIPASVDLELRGLGDVTLELGEPGRIDFVDGTVEATLPVRLPAAGLAGEVLLRFAPEIEPLYGAPLLRATSARFEQAGIDVAAFLPPVALPRRADWAVPLDASGNGGELAITCFVQGITVEPDRLRLDLGLRVAAAPTPSRR